MVLAVAEKIIEMEKWNIHAGIDVNIYIDTYTINNLHLNKLQEMCQKHIEERVWCRLFFYNFRETQKVSETRAYCSYSINFRDIEMTLLSFFFFEYKTFSMKFF